MGDQQDSASSAGLVDAEPNVNLCVGKITWADSTNNDVLEIWVNPADQSAFDAAANVIYSADNDGTNLNFSGTSSVLFRAFGDTANYDEFRLGGFLADVIVFNVIPEPGTAALLLLGLAFVGFGRMRWTRGPDSAAAARRVK